MELALPSAEREALLDKGCAARSLAYLLTKFERVNMFFVRRGKSR